MRAIAEWLASIGLEKYAQRFAENAIDFSVVSDLTEQDLKELGVPLGHRRKMLRAIAELSAAAVARTPTATEPLPRDGAERRQLTTMFCDLVGSTVLSGRLDPEDLRKVIFTYNACVTDVIRGYNGMIARYMGMACSLISVIPRQTRITPRRQCVQGSLWSTPSQNSGLTLVP
jgi:SAM domain (Sterile alpha motif)